MTNEQREQLVEYLRYKREDHMVSLERRMALLEEHDRSHAQRLADTATNAMNYLRYTRPTLGASDYAGLMRDAGHEHFDVSNALAQEGL